MRSLTAVGFALAFTIFGQSANAAPCTRAEGLQADRSLDHLHTWKDIYAAYKKLRQCDDGAIAEGYSDAVAKQLAGYWGSLNKALALFDSDPPFEAWVIGHLDETNTLEDSLRIYRLSQTACPAGAETFCGKIQARMREAECLPSHPEGVGCLARRDVGWK